jgi:hypothetical protein
LTQLIRRFRGLGVAIVVLALSAGVVFAAAPPFVPVSSNANPAAHPGSDKEDPTEEPTEDPTDEPTEEPTEEAPTLVAPVAAPTDAADSTGAPEDTHGALVSAAAHMDLPDGFPNRGSFVSCVAHMKDVTVATIIWTDVTPEACGVVEKTPPGQAKSEAAKIKAQEKAAAGKAKGQAKAAEAKSKHQQ